MSNRKLIRPSLAEIKEQLTVRQPRAKRPAPNDQTNAENFYYVKQIQNKTPMVVVLQDGAGGLGQQAPLPRPPVRSLDQGEEPEASGVQ